MFAISKQSDMQIKTVMRCLFPLIRLTKMRMLLIDSTKCGWGRHRGFAGGTNSGPVRC